MNLEIERDEWALHTKNIGFKLVYDPPKPRSYENLILANVGSALEIEWRRVSPDGTSRKVESESIDAFANMPSKPIEMGSFVFRVTKVSDGEVTFQIVGDTRNYTIPVPRNKYRLVRPKVTGQARMPLAVREE